MACATLVLPLPGAPINSMARGAGVLYKSTPGRSAAICIKLAVCHRRSQSIEDLEMQHPSRCSGRGVPGVQRWGGQRKDAGRQQSGAHCQPWRRLLRVQRHHDAASNALMQLHSRAPLQDTGRRQLCLESFHSHACLYRSTQSNSAHEMNPWHCDPREAGECLTTTIHFECMVTVGSAAFFFALPFCVPPAFGPADTGFLGSIRVAVAGRTAAVPFPAAASAAALPFLPVTPLAVAALVSASACLSKSACIRHSSNATQQHIS
jgi:hypothetical protein